MFKECLFVNVSIITVFNGIICLVPQNKNFRAMIKKAFKDHLTNTYYLTDIYMNFMYCNYSAIPL